MSQNIASWMQLWIYSQSNHIYMLHQYPPIKTNHILISIIIIIVILIIINVIIIPIIIFIISKTKQN